jgi:hypothetical protein
VPRAKAEPVLDNGRARQNLDRYSQHARNQKATTAEYRSLPLRRRCEGVPGRRGGKTIQYGQTRAENALPGAPSAACLAIKAQPPAPRSAQSIDGRTERTCHTEAALGSFLGHPRGSGGARPRRTMGVIGSRARRAAAGGVFLGAVLGVLERLRNNEAAIPPQGAFLNPDPTASRAKGGSPPAGECHSQARRKSPAGTKP